MPSPPEIAFAVFLALCLFGAVALNRWHRNQRVPGKCEMCDNAVASGETICAECRAFIATW